MISQFSDLCRRTAGSYGLDLQRQAVSGQSCAVTPRGDADWSFTLIDADQPVSYGVVVDQGRSAPCMKLIVGATRLGEYARAPRSPKMPASCPPP